MMQVKQERAFYNVVKGRKGTQRITEGAAFNAGYAAQERGDAREDIPSVLELIPELCDAWRAGYDESAIAGEGYTRAMLRAIGIAPLAMAR